MIITIPGHFACSSFAMQPLLAFAPPMRMASRDFGLRQVVLVCLRLRASPDEGIVRRRSPCDHHDSRSFCVLKFCNAPAPDICAARAHFSAPHWSSPSRARVSSVAWLTRRRNRAALAHGCHSLLRVISALSRRPQDYYVDARFIGNGPRGQLCKMIARMIVDDGASLGG